MLLLNLTRIRTAQERFEKVYEPGQLGNDPDFRVAAPVSLAFDIFKDKQQFRLVGQVRTTLELNCSRCVEPFTLPVDAAFDLRYHPQGDNTGTGEAEQEIEDDDLTTAFYEKDQIDLGHLMHEQFVLALPMKPLCSTMCKGLCVHCGTNLNTASCDCAPQWTDPRLAALNELRAKLNE